MPTVHYISRETMRKHGIGHIPLELMNKKQRVTTNFEVVDVTIRVNAAGTAAAKSEQHQPPYKSTDMDNINIDAEDNTSNISSSSSSKLNDIQPVQLSRYRKEVISQQVENLQEDECRKPSEPKVNKIRTYRMDFFDRVDDLKAYKENHGHLHVGCNEDQSLYNFGCNVRKAQRDMMSGKGTRRILTDDRIAALDAIGFDWKLEAGVSSTAASQDDRFFARVDELKAYKQKHGHLNVVKKENQSLYGFCCNMRKARKGKGTYKLDDGRIAALDAIGFNWDPLGLKMPSTSPFAVRNKNTQQATNPKMNIGDVGYQFLKEFDSGWYKGTVVEILPHAVGGWDCRCVYEDGDCEDLTLSELKQLASLSSNVGALEVEEDVKTVEDGGMKVAVKCERDTAEGSG